MSEQGNPQTEDVIQVKIAFNLKTSQCTLSSKCPSVMLLGILETAKTIVIQNNIMAGLSAMAAQAKQPVIVAPPNAGLVRPH